ncbi:MaoC family dehydratase [Photobacterium sp. GJ3]|uniref:MaoC family dehydratase n=1 Tax=Photobacterium sp. GJ3 TaxID=2829502 RepID=UPI001B8D2FC0|nr:MaoC family dehydratase [Photobacterium sp. GJ3]QUJ68044.1 MaoC family dehydratase [Photobacterium sp. GJ3]
MKAKMLSRLQPVGEQRYVESHGLYYDDFEIGDIYEHRPGRTVTEVDNIWQSLINMNTHPLHIDAVYASETEFERPLVSSLVTFSIIGGLSLASTSARAIANLGWKNVALKAPVFVGDTLYAESRILHKRLSNSRPNQGIVTVETKGLKDSGEVVLIWERSFLVPVDPELQALR